MLASIRVEINLAEIGIGIKPARLHHTKIYKNRENFSKSWQTLRLKKLT